MNQNKVGRYISILRKKRNLTQEQLAEQLGVTNRTISRWENGNYMPDVSLLKLLTKVLNTSLNELLSGEELGIKNQNNNIDYQVKFLYELNEEKELLARIDKNKDLTYKGLFYEETIQYDHKIKNQSFYQKESDSRFRLRITKNEGYQKAKISYKKRLEKESINKEEEINIDINPKDYENTQRLLENALNMEKVEIYERYVHVFENDDIKILLIRYPFMITLELINLSVDYKEEAILYWLSRLNLDINKSYKLSWDDKYKELCIQQNKTIEKYVLFNKEMPIYKK